MPVKWNVFMLMTMLGCSIFSGIMEMAWVGEGEVSVFSRLFSVGIGHQTIPFLGHIYGAMIAGVDVFLAFFDMATFDYAMFTGGYTIVRYFVWCIGLGWFITMAITLFKR